MSSETIRDLDIFEAVLTTGLLEQKPSASESDDASGVAAAPRGAAATPGHISNALGAGTLALSALAEKVAMCTRCALGSTRTNAVFGQGVSAPLVLVVGEGPGAEEDRQGLPFVGASGHLLDKMLASVGLSRETNTYIANIVKCRPPQNREPAPDERAACIGYLREQIKLLHPRVILCAGRTAAQTLLETNEGINRLRGRTLSFETIPLIASFHPSALLRDESLKRPAWEDLKRLRAMLKDL